MSALKFQKVCVCVGNIRHPWPSFGALVKERRTGGKYLEYQSGEKLDHPALNQNKQTNKQTDGTRLGLSKSLP